MGRASIGRYGEHVVAEAVEPRLAQWLSNALAERFGLQVEVEPERLAPGVFRVVTDEGPFVVRRHGVLGPDGVVRGSRSRSRPDLGHDDGRSLASIQEQLGEEVALRSAGVALAERRQGVGGGPVEVQDDVDGPVVLSAQRWVPPLALDAEGERLHYQRIGEQLGRLHAATLEVRPCGVASARVADELPAALEAAAGAGLSPLAVERVSAQLPMLQRLVQASAHGSGLRARIHGDANPYNFVPAKGAAYVIDRRPAVAELAADLAHLLSFVREPTGWAVDDQAAAERGLWAAYRSVLEPAMRAHGLPVAEIAERWRALVAEASMGYLDALLEALDAAAEGPSATIAREVERACEVLERSADVVGARSSIAAASRGATGSQAAPGMRARRTRRRPGAVDGGPRPLDAAGTGPSLPRGGGVPGAPTTVAVVAGGHEAERPGGATAPTLRSPEGPHGGPPARVQRGRRGDLGGLGAGG